MIKPVVIGLCVGLALRCITSYADVNSAIICDNNTGYCHSVSITTNNTNDNPEQTRQSIERGTLVEDFLSNR